MNNKIEGLVKWGIDAFSLIMANNLVISCTALITGLFHLFMPEQSMMFDSMILSLLMIVYASISIVLVITNYNKKVAKHQDIAGNLVKGFVDGKTSEAVKNQEFISEKTSAPIDPERSAKAIGAVSDKISDIHKKSRNVSRNIMLAFYIVILAISIFLLIRRDIAVHINHLLLGAVLIVDGVTRIISTFSAKKTYTVKNYWLSIVLSVLSVILGLLLFIMTSQTGILAMQIVSVIMILKSLGEFYVAFRNREVLSSLNGTLEQLKQQGSDAKRKG